MKTRKELLAAVKVARARFCRLREGGRASAKQLNSAFDSLQRALIAADGR